MKNMAAHYSTIMLHSNSSFFFFSSSFLNEIVSQLHLGIIHVFADRMFFVFTAD